MAEQRERVPDRTTDAPELPSVPYLNLLSFSRVSMTVPYEGSGIPRADGDANFGFKNLKRHPELLDTIPEFASDPALRSLMTAIDRPEAGLFSTACMSKTVTDSHGCRLNGYVEFAMNCRSAVTDPTHYFRLFQAFNRKLEESGFADPVSFQWEICPTEFTEVDVRGFVADVRIDTDYRPTPEGAYEVWTRALALLEELLGAVPARSATPIYTTQP